MRCIQASGKGRTREVNQGKGRQARKIEQERKERQARKIEQERKEKQADEIRCIWANERGRQTKKGKRKDILQTNVRWDRTKETGKNRVAIHLGSS
jgi:hypothetical protein